MTCDPYSGSHIPEIDKRNTQGGRYAWYRYVISIARHQGKHWDIWDTCVAAEKLQVQGHSRRQSPKGREAMVVED